MRLITCPHFAHALGTADLPGVHAYDHIGLTLIMPIITRINRYHGACPCWGRYIVAPP